MPASEINYLYLILFLGGRKALFKKQFDLLFSKSICFFALLGGRGI